MKPAALVYCVLALLGSAQGADDAWLSWTGSQAQAIGKAAYVQGRVGGIFDTRLLKTERSYNYKLAATWMTPDVIRAAARTLQLAQRLSDGEAKVLVADAEAAGGTVVMVEIDPREGSGVIPDDWSAFLGPAGEGREGSGVRGANTPKLRDVKALSGVLRRNYDYDRFWVVFPLRRSDGTLLLAPGVTQAELVVRIADREGRVKWPVPPSFKR